MKRICLLAAIASLAGAGTPASGQQNGWVNCNEITQTRAVKLVITDLIGQQEHAGILADFHEKLVLKVSANAPAGGESAVVLCGRSRPQSHEFERKGITSLDDQRILTVIWGRLGNEAMTLHMVLVPYRLEALQKSLQGSRGLDTQQFRIRDGTKTAEFLRLLVEDRVTELAYSYFVLGMGLRYLSNREYGRAQTSLCMAKRNFLQLGARTGQQPPPDVLALLEEKLKIVAASMTQRPDAAAFTRDHPAENCGG